VSIKGSFLLFYEPNLTYQLRENAGRESSLRFAFSAFSRKGLRRFQTKADTLCFEDEFLGCGKYLEGPFRTPKKRTKTL